MTILNCINYFMCVCTYVCGRAGFASCGLQTFLKNRNLVLIFFLYFLKTFLGIPKYSVHNRVSWFTKLVIPIIQLLASCKCNFCPAIFVNKIP